MNKNLDTSERKKDHIDICINEDVAYNYSNGFDKYAFEHNAVTEIDYNEISIITEFFGKEVDFPFIVSCMTGGTGEAKFINDKLIEAALELNIPIGVGSQRQLLENDNYKETYTVFKKVDNRIPVLGNIGAAQVAQLDSMDPINRIIESVNASSLVIHCNALQELLQAEGEPGFKGLLKSIEKICTKIDIPVIVKEVGAGINKQSAKKLLDVGVRGIDTAGAGGTSWGAVELLRNNKRDESYFRNWGLPTSYCVRTVNELKTDYDFKLISSGGINTFDDIAKSIAMGADFTASARSLLMIMNQSGSDGLIEHIKELFENVKRIMFLTGCETIDNLKTVKLIKKEDMF